MPVGTDTQYSSASATFDGLDVNLGVTLPTWTDGTLPVQVDITTDGLAPDINIALVVDTSGSTSNNSGSDVDGDGVNDTYLEAQQLAAKELFQSFLDAGYDPASIEITLIEYNTDGHTLGTFTLDQQSAFDTAVDGLNSGGQTNYESGLDEVLDTWATAGDVDNTDTNAVVFLSDGFRNRGDDASDERLSLETLYNAKITAIGIGANSSLTNLNIIDNTGGAEKVTDLSQLLGVITAPPPLPDLEFVEVFVDGVSYGTFTPGDGVLESTALGFRINCVDIAGWPYTPGDTINVEVCATFTGGAHILCAAGVIVPVTICFGQDTQILTISGYKTVQDLRCGDAVMTRDNGLQEIRWIGSTHLTAAQLQADENLRPVKIAAHTFGPDMPENDLTVSRQHRILVEDWRAEILFDSDKVLVPAHALVNEKTVTNECPADGVTYFHMVFDEHEIVDAQGLMTESFHPCRATVLGMKPEARAELFALFPQLVPAEENIEAIAYDPAYPMLKAFEGRLLAPKLAS